MDRWPLIDGEKFSIAPPMAVEYHTTSPGAQRIDGGVVVKSPPWMYRTMVDGPMAAGSWSTVDAECVALRGCSTAPWMYRAMVGGAVVTDRCSAAWR